MRERLNRYIDVEARPVQVLRARQLDPADLSDGSILEPGVVLERDEQFVIVHEQPEPVW
jgi:hypothetical protein